LLVWYLKITVLQSLTVQLAYILIGCIGPVDQGPFSISGHVVLSGSISILRKLWLLVWLPVARLAHATLPGSDMQDLLVVSLLLQVVAQFGLPDSLVARVDSSMLAPQTARLAGRKRTHGAAAAELDGAGACDDQEVGCSAAPDSVNSISNTPDQWAPSQHDVCPFLPVLTQVL
jgi:hypothetical protein